MSLDILLTLVATVVVQSIFGAGVLLFGTPVLLLLGYDFVDALAILLPVSLVVNGLQIAKHHAAIDLSFYRRILCFSLPPIALFLFIVTHARINIGLFIGPFLLFIALKEFSPAAARTIDALMKYEKPYFVLMGAIHGFSNLGGSLLTALVHHKAYPKDTARVTVAASYATFALVQLLTLFAFSAQPPRIGYSEEVIYAVIAALAFVMADDMLYLHIGQSKYQRLFSAFLAISGLLLVAKSW